MHVMSVPMELSIVTKTRSKGTQENMVASEWWAYGISSF